MTTPQQFQEALDEFIHARKLLDGLSEDVALCDFFSSDEIVETIQEALKRAAAPAIESDVDLDELRQALRDSNYYDIFIQRIDTDPDNRERAQLFLLRSAARLYLASKQAPVAAEVMSAEILYNNIMSWLHHGDGNSQRVIDLIKQRDAALLSSAYQNAYNQAANADDYIDALNTLGELADPEYVPIPSARSAQQQDTDAIKVLKALRNSEWKSNSVSQGLDRFTDRFNAGAHAALSMAIEMLSETAPTIEQQQDVPRKYCYWPDEYAVKVDSNFIPEQTVICKTSVGKDGHKYGLMIVDALNAAQTPTTTEE